MRLVLEGGERVEVSGFASFDYVSLLGLGCSPNKSVGCRCVGEGPGDVELGQ